MLTNIIFKGYNNSIVLHNLLAALASYIYYQYPYCTRKEKIRSRGIIPICTVPILAILVGHFFHHTTFLFFHVRVKQQK